MSDEKNDKQPAKREKIVFALDPVSMKQLEAAEKAEAEEAEGKPDRAQSVLEMILKSLKAQDTRLSFESDPLESNQSFGSMYKNKFRLVPDHIIKRLVGPQGDDLLCAILQARSNMVASFGRPRSSRFANGFEFQEVDKDRRITDEQKEKERQRLAELKDIFWNCGSKNVDDEFIHPNFSQFLKMITRDGLAFGRLAVEFIWDDGITTGKKKLHAWRPVDAGTIYPALPRNEQDQSTRIDGLRLLQQLKNEEFDAQRFERDEYKYYQVIDGTPRMAFSDEELVVYNLYPVTNVEYNGFPLTPIDQTLNAITTHINITLHNKLYFQNGRAAKGMLIYQSDEVDESVVQKIRLQYHQSINNVNNSWRVPVFGIQKDDQLQWTGTDVAGRDAEFQYLSDSNARVILSAFQMSPEELPGYAHLARGTNTQALSESDNEYKLTAARDVGLRPLLYDIQDFLNTHILPKLDSDIAKHYQIVLAGLEHDSPEKEATRLSQDMPIHMTMNEVLEHVEKRKLPAEVGGDMPFNPQYRQTVDAYMTVGQVLEFFFKRKGAAADPRFNYVRDPFWLQFQQLLLAKAQFSAQMSMAQQQAAAGQAGGEPPPGQEEAPPGASDTEKAEVYERNLRKTQEWLTKNGALLEKTIRDNHSELSKLILRHHKAMAERHVKAWREDANKAVAEIAAVFKDGDEGK